MRRALAAGVGAAPNKSLNRTRTPRGPLSSTLIARRLAPAFGGGMTKGAMLRGARVADDVLRLMRVSTGVGRRLT